MNKNKQIHKLAEENFSIAIIWDAEDVIETAENMGIKLDNIQAMEVLKLIKDTHDCNYGVTWDHIENGINQLFN